MCVLLLVSMSCFLENMDMNPGTGFVHRFLRHVYHDPSGEMRCGGSVGFPPHAAYAWVWQDD